VDAVEHAEMVEKQLDAMIERRARKGEERDEREALWQGSVRRYNARRREELRASARPYLHNTAARFASKGSRSRP
jgi:hypothetical protein